MPRFGKSQKNPADVVKSLRDALDVLDKSQDKKKLDKVCQISRQFLLSMVSSNTQRQLCL